MVVVVVGGAAAVFHCAWLGVVCIVGVFLFVFLRRDVPSPHEPDPAVRIHHIFARHGNDPDSMLSLHVIDDGQRGGVKIAAQTLVPHSYRGHHRVRGGRCRRMTTFLLQATRRHPVVPAT